MTSIRTVAYLYARISEDPRDLRRGVKRQLADLQQYAGEQGWPIAGEYVENDRSAWSPDVERPEYDALMKAAVTLAAEPGVNVVVCGYHPSRLWRDRVERAQAIEVGRRAGLTYAFESGGIFNMRRATERSMLAQIGENDTAESDVKSERVQRAALERAQEGRANGKVAYGWQRRYLHDDSGQVIGFEDHEHPEQAPIVREIVGRLLAGESLLSLTADLNERDIPAPGAGQRRKHRTLGQDENGTRWNKTSVKKIALRPANVGIRTHRDVEYPAAWPALITPEQYAQVKNLFADRATTREKPGARKHLLSWGEIAVCGVCGSHLRVAMKGNAQRGARKPTYVCDSPKGCVGRNEEALDNHVGKIVVKLLSRPEAADVFRGDDTAALAALDRAAGLKARQDAAADDYAAGILTRDQLVRITQQLAKQITDSQAEARRLRPAFDLSVFDGLVGPQAGERWEKLEVAQKRHVLEGLGLRLKVFPAARRGPGFDASTIKMRWGAMNA